MAPQDKKKFTSKGNLLSYKKLVVYKQSCCIQLLKTREFTSAGRRFRLFYGRLSEGEQNTHYFVNARRERTAARTAAENNACSV